MCVYGVYMCVYMCVRVSARVTPPPLPSRRKCNANSAPHPFSFTRLPSSHSLSFSLSIFLRLACGYVSSCIANFLDRIARNRSRSALSSFRIALHPARRSLIKKKQRFLSSRSRRTVSKLPILTRPCRLQS